MHVYLHSTAVGLFAVPKLHQLDFLDGNGKTVRLIRTVATNWKTVAIILHFKYHYIDWIERANHYQEVSACRAMFSEWLDGKGRRPTNWNTLIKALRETDLSEIASDLEYVLGMIVTIQLPVVKCPKVTILFLVCACIISILGIIPYSQKIWQFGSMPFKICQIFHCVHVCMVIPYHTAKFQFANNISGYMVSHLQCLR